MIRPFNAFLLTPVVIALLDALMLFPLGFAIVDLVGALHTRKDHIEMLDVVTSICVLIIGWSTVLAKRQDFREIFSLHAHDEGQGRIDRGCRHTAAGTVVFGFFALMSMQVIWLPNRILNTEGVERTLVGAACVFFGIVCYILIRHIVILTRTAGVQLAGWSHGDEAPDRSQRIGSGPS
jgi:hypothetical protein